MKRSRAAPIRRSTIADRVIPLVAAATAVVTLPVRIAWATETRVWIADDLARLRRGDVDSPLAAGRANGTPGAPIRVTAFRDEIIAFQVIIEAGDADLSGVTVDLEALTSTSGVDLGRAERFIEHYVELRSRSRNDRRPRESLGWSPGARPPDERTLGAMPDALVPVDLAARSTFVGYPMRVARRTLGAIWIDQRIPRDIAPGGYAGTLAVSSDAGSLARIPIAVTVRAPRVPYRAVRFFAYYDPAELRERIGDSAGAEPQLWQLLHAHHVDALATLNRPDDAERLAPALDGSLFTAAHGYDGPGSGVAPGVAALGSYGTLGDPSDAGLATVRAIAPRIPAAVEDVILYAVDEQCDSSRGPGWRRLLRGAPELARVRVAHTCSEDPATRDVDVALVAADQFDVTTAQRARADGRRVWVYNGALPRTGTFLLDADATSAVVNPWIAALYPVDRWFLWETTFWNDDNRGGRGPVDPFVTAESFHNQHGDAALGDGLLVYPGAQTGAFAPHSFGFAGVLPSMRLKRLRRGIQDAGIYALALGARPDEAAAIAHGLVRAALSDVSAIDPPAWPADGAGFADARDRLRDLIPENAAMTADDVARVLARPHASAAASTPRFTTRWFIAGAILAAIALAASIAVARRRRRAGDPRNVRG